MRGSSTNKRKKESLNQDVGAVAGTEVGKRVRKGGGDERERGRKRDLLEGDNFSDGHGLLLPLSLVEVP